MKGNKVVKLILTIIILVLTMSSITGCGKTDAPISGAKEEQVLIIHDDAWEGVDLFQVSSWNDMQTLLADTILEKDSTTGGPLPKVASNSQWSEDGLTWTLTFPEEMYFSTGKQVEPEDFIASVEYGLRVSPYADGYRNIKSMEVNGRDVIIHLNEYQADMQYNFQDVFVGIISKDEIENMSADEMLWGCHPYGAYYLDEYQPGAYAILKANEGYKTNNPLLKNQGPSPIKTIKVVFTGESFTLAQGVKNGDYDVLSSVPVEYYDELKSASNIEVVEASGASLQYAELNMCDPILQDINIRKSIIHGISRDNLGTYLSDFEKPAYSFILEKCLNYSEEAVEYGKENYGYNPELSKQLLAESGWVDSNNDGFVDKNGNNLTIEFNCRDTEVSKKVAQSVQIDMKNIGIDMQIKTQNWSYVNQDVVDGNFQMAYLGLGWSEPFLLVDIFVNRNAECTNPDPENYSAMVAKARKTVDFNEVTEQITAIQKNLFDYSTIIPLVDMTDFRCWRNDIKGIVYTPTGGFYLGDVVTDENGNFNNVK